MNDAEVDALLEKACSTPNGKIRASFLLADLEKMAPAFANPATRPAVEAAVARWQDGPDQLRKGISMAWLSRARSMIQPAARSAVAAVGRATGATAAGKAIGAAVERGAGKAGDIGAAAGEKLARSPLNAKRMAAARQKGGEEAQARMAERLKPGSGQAAPRGRMEMEGQAAPRMEAPSTQPFMPETREGPQRWRPRQNGTSSGFTNAADRTAAVHADALSSAFRAGAEHAGNAHAGAAARHGRVAARHAFKMGVKVGGGAAAVAGAGVAAGLSQAQHEERVNAGKHSHDNRRGMRSAA